MIDLKTMRWIYKDKGYSDEQLLKIRDFLHDLAEIQLKIRKE